MLTVSSPVRTQDEQKELLAELTPFAAIAALDQAPAGCRMWRLREAAAVAAAARDEAAQRAEGLRERLAAADVAIAGAQAADDFAALAQRRAERQAISDGLAAVEGDQARATAGAAVAERKRDGAWSLVASAISALRQMIVGGDSFSHRYESRAPYCWQTLRGLLTPGAPATPYVWQGYGGSPND